MACAIIHEGTAEGAIHPPPCLGQAGDTEVNIDLRLGELRVVSTEASMKAALEALEQRLGIRPGSVSPFAVYNDKAGVVTVGIGADLLAADGVTATR